MITDAANFTVLQCSKQKSEWNSTSISKHLVSHLQTMV